MPLVTAGPQASFEGPAEQGFAKEGLGMVNSGLEPRGSPHNHYQTYFVRSYFMSQHHKWEFSPQLHSFHAPRAKTHVKPGAHSSSLTPFRQIFLFLLSSYKLLCIH